MRKTVGVVASSLVLVSAPAAAIGLDDIAKVVLKDKAVLKKADTKCGTAAKLTAADNSTIDTAVAAVRRAIAPNTFSSLENTAKVEAETQSQSPTFCPETVKKKKGLLSRIGKAGKSILKGGLGL